MKRKINLVGDSFTHLTGGNKGYSVHGKTSKHIEWVSEGGECTFYIDDMIHRGISDDSDSIKYLWLLESVFIKPGLVEFVLKNRELVESTFENIFTYDKRLLSLSDKYKWVPANGFWIKDPKIYDKTKMISFITSNKCMCPGHKTRLSWVERIGDQVDLYGRGLNEIESKEDGLCDYMFSVAMENGQSETYFTEKLLDCFATGTIPIYWGAPDIGDHFNMDGIIILNEEFDVSEEIYYSKMDAIKDNLERAKKIEILEDYIYKTYLEK